MTRVCIFYIGLFFFFFPRFLMASQPVCDLSTGLTYFDNQQYPEALEYFQKLVEENPGDGAILYYLGRSYFQSRQIIKAIDALDQAVKIDDTNADYYYLLGLSYASYISELNMLKQMSVAKKMRTAWLKAVELEKAHRDANVALIGYYITAPGFAGGSMKKAEKHLSILKQYYPDEEFPERGLILEKKEQYEEAEKYLRLSVEKNKCPRYLFNLASYLYRHEKYDEAMEFFKAYISMKVSWKDPRKTLAHFYLGAMFANKKLVAKARTELQLAKTNCNDILLNEMAEKQIRELN